MDAKSFWHLNSHKYKTYWIANANDDKIIFEKSDDLWRYMNDFLEQSHKPVVSGKQPDYRTIHATAKSYSKDIWGQKDDIFYKNSIKDFEAGAKWALSQVACANGAVDTVAEVVACEHPQEFIEEDVTMGVSIVVCKKCGEVL